MGEIILNKFGSKKRIIGIILCLCLIIAIVIRVCLDYQNMDRPLNETEISEGTRKFKQEYESLNGTKNSSDQEYPRVNIDENVVIQYKTDEEIVDILNQGTGVVYFGFNTCPWCRSMIETLIASVKDSKVIDFYYVDIKDIRSSFDVNKRKLVNTKKGTDSYYKILEKLDVYLEDYKLEVDGKKYDTKEKRLYAPTVVAFKDGEIVAIHQSTVETQTNPYVSLTEEERSELKGIYNDMFNKLLITTCNENKSGC